MIAVAVYGVPRLVTCPAAASSAEISLRVCPETLCGIAEFSQHEADGGEAQEGERPAVEALPILGQSATAAEPGETAFDDPALGDPLNLIRVAS